MYNMVNKIIAVIKTGKMIEEGLSTENLSLGNKIFLKDIELDQWYKRNEVGRFGFFYHCLDGFIHYPFSNGGNKDYFLYYKDKEIVLDSELEKTIKHEIRSLGYVDLHTGMSENWKSKNLNYVRQIDI